MAMAGQGPRRRDLALHVPAAVESAVKRAMALESADRFASAAESGAVLGRTARSLRTD